MREGESNQNGNDLVYAMEIAAQSQVEAMKQTCDGIVRVAASFDAMDSWGELLEVVARQVPLFDGWKDFGRAHSKGADDGQLSQGGFIECRECNLEGLFVDRLPA